ncbi:hypothetical protein BSKO_02819 [Bryopsis sp. KO-2023]|nr:hypothetical protein BSKO_02819 [Bryopsis sp. KO-2023]
MNAAKSDCGGKLAKNEGGGNNQEDSSEVPPEDQIGRIEASDLGRARGLAHVSPNTGIVRRRGSSNGKTGGDGN